MTSKEAIGLAREPSAYLAAIIDSSDDAIVSKDLAGIVQSWNPGAERLFGYTADEMVGRSIRTIIPGEKQAEEDHVLARLRSGERVDHFETVRLRKDNSRVFVSLTVSPVHSADGTIIGASKIARDITARKLTDAKTVAERHAFQALAEGAPLQAVLEQLIAPLESQGDELRASILLLDDDGVHLRHGAAPSLPEAYNRAVEGMPIGPVAGSCGTAAYRAQTVVVPDIARDPLWAPYPAIRDLAVAAGLRACWSTPILSSQEKVLGTFALYFPDVRPPTPDQLEFTQALSRSAAALIEARRASEARARLSALVNSSEDPIISVTLDGMVRDWNPACERLYGYTAGEMVGQPFTMVIPERAHAEFWEKMARIREGAPVPAFDSTRLHKDGHEVPVSVKLSPVVDEQGTVIGASSIHRDITDRKALERLQQEFLAMVTHELRNPLTAVRGFASILQRRKAYIEEAVDTIVDESRVLERLVNDLLDASRVEVGQLQIRPEEMDLSAEVQACCAQARETSSAHTVVAVTPDRPVLGYWDRVRVDQVITNLLTNAIKYSEGGEVLVRVEAGDTEARVDVVDHGKGITPEHLPHLFERFYRVDAAQHTVRSLGLGLYIARGIVERHGGRIWAESKGADQGSTFSFTLPL